MTTDPMMRVAGGRHLVEAGPAHYVAHPSKNVAVCGEDMTGSHIPTAEQAKCERCRERLGERTGDDGLG